jgi:hypothetical protein
LAESGYKGKARFFTGKIFLPFFAVFFEKKSEKSGFLEGKTGKGEKCSSSES